MCKWNTIHAKGWKCQDDNIKRSINQNANNNGMTLIFDFLRKQPAILILYWGHWKFKILYRTSKHCNWQPFASYGMLKMETHFVFGQDVVDQCPVVRLAIVYAFDKVKIGVHQVTCTMHWNNGKNCKQQRQIIEAGSSWVFVGNCGPQ